MGLRGTLGVCRMAATWSLAVEEQFYVTIPFLIRRISRSGLTFVLFSIVITAPLLRSVLLLWLQHGNFVGYIFMPCRADSLSLGVLCAIVARTPRWWAFLLARRETLLLLTSFFAFGLIPLA
jgi:peptidoglycan/LPS O-acetylase OafA/YrhL